MYPRLALFAGLAGGLLSTSSATSHAGSCISYADGPQIAGSLGSSFCDADVSDNLLYGVDETGLTVLDVSIPGSPVTLATLSFGDMCGHVVVDGDVLWVANDTGVLRSVDVSDPSAPAVLSSLVTYEATDLLLDDDRLLLVAYRDIQLFDVSVPSAPVAIDELNDTDPTRVATSFGDLAYVAFLTATDVELRVLDFGGGTIDLVGSTELFVPTFGTAPVAGSMVTDGVDLYSSWFFVGQESGCISDAPILVVDVSTPASPIVVDEWVDADAPLLALSADRLFAVWKGIVHVFDRVTEALVGETMIGSGGSWITTNDTTVFTRDQAVLVVDDVSPSRLGTLADLEPHGKGLVVRDDFIYALGARFFPFTPPTLCQLGETALYALDTTAPFGLGLDSILPTVGGYGRRIFDDGDRLYTVTTEIVQHSGAVFGALNIHDLSSHPATPLGVYSDILFEFHDAAAIGTMAYLLIEDSGEFYLRVLDTTDPSAIVALNDVSVLNDETARGIERSMGVVQSLGTHLYVGFRDAPGTVVLDLTDPTLPAIVGSHPYSPAGTIDGTEFITEGSELRVLDITDPISPVSLAHADVAASGHALVTNDVVYWSSEITGTTLVDRTTLDVLDGELPVGGPITWLGSDLLVYGNGEIRVYPPSCGAVVGVGDTAGPSAIVQAAPNPFARRTTLSFAGIDVSDGAGLTITDVSGRTVKRLALGRGSTSVTWDGTDSVGRAVSPGVYFTSIDGVTGRHRIVRLP